MAHKKKYNSFDEMLRERLKSSTRAKQYLNEALKDQDPSVFLLALRDVLLAQGVDVSALAKKAQLSRQSIYRMLSPSGNPRWENISSLVHALGLQVHLK